MAQGTIVISNLILSLTFLSGPHKNLASVALATLAGDINLSIACVIMATIYPHTIFQYPQRPRWFHFYGCCSPLIHKISVICGQKK